MRFVVKNNFLLVLGSPVDMDNGFLCLCFGITLGTYYRHENTINIIIPCTFTSVVEKPLAPCDFIAGVVVYFNKWTIIQTSSWSHAYMLRSSVGKPLT